MGRWGFSGILKARAGLREAHRDVLVAVPEKPYLTRSVLEVSSDHTRKLG